MNNPPSINNYVDRVTAGPGGAMTEEVGVITGDLTVATILLSDGRSARVAVQHSDGDTWYTLSGSPAPVPQGQLAAYHRDLLGRIRRGGGTRAT
ncbi:MULTISPECIES: hypothetical protein [unclassified Streptomyces]|uniref:hypothetical protein n=1 Tax=unclassified Streptomyces TaxID=2593676 RepID=UPI0008948CD7|nr:MULTISPECIES: hypothetical protein [unclassified Streptomyces]PKW11861.1 hypothetical protein BX260_7188 [Streptomyces sp. 5112.2]SEB68250.1 hypothetical protein SAMN05428944_0905 [Streptomyces sp. 1222.5]SEE23544.1 hypothetical protein SAMN05216532_7439 [Streptomyces sp. 2231.1]